MEKQYKDSGIKWIGRIPKKWNLCRIKDIAYLYNGNSIKDEEKDWYTDSANARPYISTKDITAINNSVNYDNGLYIKNNDTVFEIAPEGSTLMCIEGGSAGVKKAYVNRPVSFVNKLCCFRPRKVIGKYLYYFLCSPNFEDNFRRRITGLIGGVSVSDLKNFNFILPSNEEQLQIINFLDRKCDEIDSLINLQEQMIQRLTEYKLSFITEAVTKGLDPNVQLVPSGIDWINDIPKGWKITKVKWQLRERKEYSEKGEEEPLSMSQKYGLIPTKEMDIIPNMASSFVGAKLAYEGDLVFNKLKAHLGVFAVSKYNGLVSPDYAVYYKRNNCSMKYLEYLFKTPQYIAEFRKLSTGVGAGLTRLYSDDLFSISCICPPIEEQEYIAHHISERCSEIDNLIMVKQQKIEKLKDYKKSVIYEAVTGKTVIC